MTAAFQILLVAEQRTSTRVAVSAEKIQFKPPKQTDTPDRRADQSGGCQWHPANHGARDIKREAGGPEGSNGVQIVAVAEY